VKPKILIPAHGESLHLHEHAKLARRLGVPTVIECRNGDLVELAPQPGIIDELPAGRIYKDGAVLIEADSRTVADRRRLSFAGAVSVAMAVTENGELAADPEIDLIGIPERGRSGELMSNLAFDTAMKAFENLPRARRRDPDSVADAVRGAVRGAIAQNWGKKPMCHVHVLAV
jgi:ribonuclease J